MPLRGLDHGSYVIDDVLVVTGNEVAAVDHHVDLCGAIGYGLRGQLLVSGRAVGLFFQTGLLFFPQGHEGGHAPGVIVGGKLLVGQAVAGLHMARAVVPLEGVEGLGRDAVQEQHFPVHSDDAVGRDDGDVCFHARPP